MVKPRKDLTGVVFGHLTVIEQTDDYIKPNGVHEARWLCECDCENHTKIKLCSWQLGPNKRISCGHCPHDKVRVRNDLTGMTFGRWIVIEQADDYINPSGIHYAQWLCECSCNKHTRKVIQQSTLINKESQSCGCIAQEVASKIHKKYNDYTYSNDYGIGYCHNTGTEFYFDWEDFDKIKDYCWREKIAKDGYHSVVADVPHKRKNLPLHQLIVSYKLCDHRNRNSFDNRKSNLRDATKNDNSRNKSLQRNNTSGIIGVSFRQDLQKWRARIVVENKEIYIGTFIYKEDAIRARLKAELEYFGEFAPQQHLFGEYGISINTEE